MNNKTKRVSINQFEKALNRNNTVELILDGTTDVAFNVEKTISLNEAMSFVSEVVDSCVDGVSLEYIPEVYDFAIRVGVLSYYSNLKLPTSAKDQYTLVYGTSAYDQILQYINYSQYKAIIDAIDKKISYMTNIMLSTMSSKVNEMIDSFNDMTKADEGMLSSIDPDALADVVSYLSLKNKNNTTAYGDASDKQDTIVLEK